MASLKYWLWLTTRRGLGAPGALRVLEHFASPERAYYADPEEYALVSGLDEETRQSLADKDTGQADRILAACDSQGLRLLTLQDADYPERLRQIPVPPPVLYIRGRLPAFDEEAAIGLVGTRTPTAYGEQMAGRLGFELARGGALVVSGIARGLDSAALKGALKAGGTVVSVLGGGADVYYPRENRWLYEDVAAAGALITEYPPGTENLPGHFPVRNRIISGLCLGVAAIECGLHSGTMRTMEWVWEQDRDAFAVPGPVGAPMSEGTNRLIQQGAKLITCGEDILMEYRGRYPVRLPAPAAPDPETVRRRLEEPARPAPRPAPPPEPEREVVPLARQKERFTDDELAVLTALGEARRSADELVELTGIPVRRVTTALTMLQVRAAVAEDPGRRFSSLLRLEAEKQNQVLVEK